MSLNMNSNIICQLLKINESIFEGNPLPDTVEDVIIFFTTENINQNNIPKHITLFLNYNRENPHNTDDENIKRCQILWLCEEIQFHLNKIEGVIDVIIENNDIFQMKIECYSNIFSKCIDNFDIFRNMGENFHRVSGNKIREIFSASRNGKVTHQDEVYIKAVTLNNLMYDNDIF